MNPATEARQKVVVVNAQGLHARPVMQFVDLATTFESNVTVQRGDKSVDGRDPMDMMLLEATQGTELTIIARGNDAAVAVQALADLVRRGFDHS